MKKTKIVNKKGFILVETLIVGVFIMGIFSLLYTNFFPLIGEYERYKAYDTVESTYIAHWARMIALKGLTDSSYTTAKNTGYLDITDCSLYTNSDGIASCSAFINMNNVSKIYLTPYSTVDFKNFVKDNKDFSRSFREYISYLPTYSKNNNKTPDSGYYRVIVEYVSNDVYRYGNIEVYIGNSNYYNCPMPEIGDDNVYNVLLNNIPDENQYNSGTDIFITGEDPNNYIWYSGNLWRVVSIDSCNRSAKLVSEWNVSALSYDDNDSNFEKSNIRAWLNDTSIDGFLGNLRDYDKFVVTDAEWDASMMSSVGKPSNSAVLKNPVGLLNIYEYTMSGMGIDISNSYLNNGLIWWTLTPYDSSNMWYIYSDGTYDYSTYGSIMGTNGIRPSINLKYSVKIIDGSGTRNDPYRLEGDNDTNLSGTLLKDRYSGEYIRFGTGENNLYRIVSHENGKGTKIVSEEPLKNSSGNFISLVFDNNSKVSYSSTNTIGEFLNGTYLTNYLTSEQVDMIEDNTTWYLGTITSGGIYQFAKYTDTTMNTLTLNTTNAKVGLLRYGELMAGQFNRYMAKGGGMTTGLNAFYWTLTPYGSSNIVRVNYLGSADFATSYPNDPLNNGVRPVLNLKSNVIITGGDGTINNPFTLKLG